MPVAAPTFNPLANQHPFNFSEVSPRLTRHEAGPAQQQKVLANEEEFEVGDTLDEPDIMMLLNLIKDEIVNELRLPPSVSAVLGPAF